MILRDTPSETNNWELAREIRKAFRPDDIVARIGGDEFVILLPETDTTTTIKVVERVKEVIHDFNQLNPEHNPISFAIGFATSESTPNLSDVLRNADRDMYIQKAIHYAVKWVIDFWVLTI
jgi:diguanylate cyclase (GGDEF)-like protein